LTDEIVQSPHHTNIDCNAKYFAGETSCSDLIKMGIPPYYYFYRPDIVALVRDFYSADFYQYDYQMEVPK
jgi:hypothetical protein